MQDARDGMIDNWVASLLVDPVSKLPAVVSDFPLAGGRLDARIFLRHTPGFNEWRKGQEEYERYETTGAGYNSQIDQYRREIDYDRPTYDKFRMRGRVLDVGGGSGTVREFLPSDVDFVSIDPFVDVLAHTPQSKFDAYECLQNHLNLVHGFAEFLPFRNDSFDWVHMRSMLDHVQVPDLALLEAGRVLKKDGHLLVGMHVEGGRSGRVPRMHAMAHGFKKLGSHLGVSRWRDDHSWHPTYPGLVEMLSANGFEVFDEYWQPVWNDSVVYLLAHRVNLKTDLLLRAQ